MICPHCGHKNEEGIRFCTGCGEPLTEKEERVIQKGKPPLLFIGVLLAVGMLFFAVLWGMKLTGFNLRNMMSRDLKVFKTSSGYQVTLTSAQQKAVDSFIARNAGWQMLLPSNEFRPAYSADFNEDGIKDFSAVMRNVSQNKSAIVVFNGQKNHSYVPIVVHVDDGLLDRYEVTTGTVPQEKREAPMIITESRSTVVAKIIYGSQGTYRFFLSD